MNPVIMESVGEKPEQSSNALGSSLLCFLFCPLCFLAFLYFSAYYAYFYVFHICIMFFIFL